VAVFPHFCPNKREYWHESCDPLSRAKFHVYRNNLSLFRGEKPILHHCVNSIPVKEKINLRYTLRAWRNSSKLMCPLLSLSSSLKSWLTSAGDKFSPKSQRPYLSSSRSSVRLPLSSIARNVLYRNKQLSYRKQTARNCAHNTSRTSIP